VVFREVMEVGMYESARILKKEFEEVFGGELNERQLWFIVNVAKGVRRYCRSNAAFNNYFTSIFGDIAEFKQVVKHRDGKSYEGLRIVMKE